MAAFIKVDLLKRSGLLLVASHWTELCVPSAQVLYGGWPDQAKEDGPERYGPRAAHWTAVDEFASLAAMLSKNDYVIPGVPVFFVLVRGSSFESKFLADEIPLL